jgi:hypothetical protein
MPVDTDRGSALATCSAAESRLILPEKLVYNIHIHETLGRIHRV